MHPSTCVFVRSAQCMHRNVQTSPDKAQMSSGEEEITWSKKKKHNSNSRSDWRWFCFQRVYSHGMRLLELADLLDMVHKVSSVYILHHKVQSVLEYKGDDISRKKEMSQLQFFMLSIAKGFVLLKQGIHERLQHTGKKVKKIYCISKKLNLVLPVTVYTWKNFTFLHLSSLSYHFLSVCGQLFLCSCWRVRSVSYLYAKLY